MITELVMVVILALGLSVDTFAAAVTKGATLSLGPRDKARVAGVFSVCAVVALGLGWGFGYVASNVITEFDHWIAFGLLSAVGVHMVWNGWHHDGQDGGDLTRGRLWATAVGTNVDAMAVGIGLAFVEVNVSLVCLAVAFVTVGAVYGGIAVGKKTGDWLGAKAEILGGIVLVGMGIKILLQHLLA